MLDVSFMTQRNVRGRGGTQLAARWHAGGGRVSAAAVARNRQLATGGRA
jgi:hypothetical protein